MQICGEFNIYKIMNVSVINDGVNAPVALFDLAQTAVSATLSKVLGRCDLQVSVLFASVGHMRELNLQFNNEDKITDVLAFNRREEWHTGKLTKTRRADEFPRENQSFLGDIAICLEQTHEQAVENDVSAEHELAKLTVHGTLHLLGYDHHTTKDEQQMFALTDQILDTIFERKQ